MKGRIKYGLLVLALCLGCALSPLAAAMAVVERSGSWFDPTHDGEGFVVQFINDNLAVVYWFTYDADGAQRWFTGLGNASGDELHFPELLVTQGGEFGPGFDKDAVKRIAVGELTLTFASDSAGTAAYVIDGTAGEQSIVRATRPVEVVAAASPTVPRKSGSWYNPERDGEGLILEILEDGRQVVYWFTYDINGNQAWMLSLGGASAAEGSFSLDMLQPVGGRFGPEFDPADVVREPVGRTRVSLQCDGSYLDFTNTDPVDFVSFGFDLQQLVGIGPNSCVDPVLVNRYPADDDGRVATPDNAAGQQMRWLLDRFAGDEPFSDEVLREHFSDAWLANNSLAVTRNLLTSNRQLFRGAGINDPISMAPTSIVAVLTAQDNRRAFTVLDANLGDGKINSLYFYDYGFGGTSVIYASDAALSMDQAADRFASLSDQPGLVVARINDQNQCQAVTGRNANTLRSTASIFKIWVLAGVASALDERALYHDQVAGIDGGKQVRGGPLFAEPAGLPLSVDQLSTLMMGVSDNTATDMLLALAGRDRIDGLHAEYGHSMPEVMAPQLGISEQFHLFFSFPMAESMEYLDGTESFQRQFLEERIVPLGASGSGGGGYNNESLFIDGAWRASPMDVCGAFARHRLHAPGSDAALLVDRALQTSAAQPNLRSEWDRVWYKGGSLESGANGLLVLTHAFMLEREGEDPVVVVAMANHPAGGIDATLVQSIVGRLLALAATLPAQAQ
ncbi:serine hydrolase [Marinihelvus fidelis]|nr:serine hydrolase [Marinihelvus fidelis]